MEPNETSKVNQASGTSIFWALIALALNALTEPSRIGSLFFRPPGDPDTSFDPLRSSPIVCASETMLDILFIFFNPKPQESLSEPDALPHTPNVTEPRSVAKGQKPGMLRDPAVATAPQLELNTDNTSPTRTTLKVIAFFLGVLPQAIKLFSMSGITGTQICAAMFLAASVARAISFKSPSHFAMSVDALKSGTYRAPGVTLLIFLSIAHFVLYIWLYFNIAGGLFFDDAAVPAAANDWRAAGTIISLELAIFTRFAYMMFGMLTIMFNILRGQSLTTSQWLPLLMLVWLQGRYNNSAEQLADSATWIVPPPLWLTNLSRALALIAMSLIGCLQVSALCVAVGRVLSRLAAERAARSSGHSDGSLPPMATNADEPGSRSRFHHIIDTLWQAMVWLKDVFVDLRTEVDNDEEWLGTWHEGFGATTEQLGLTWGIFNLLTALLYYLVVFDSTGTSSPSWTSVLG